jgi:predicted nicotinamide N-methyase
MTTSRLAALMRSFKLDGDKMTFIQRNTTLTNSNLVPELMQYLATPKSCLFKYTEDDLLDNGLPPPFWSFFWAGGQALTRFILDNPHVVRNKRVFDFGCGSGAISFSCLKNSCRTVEANDIDSWSLAATLLNLHSNDSSLPTDWSSRLKLSDRNYIDEPIETDVIFVGDMFYDSDMGTDIINWLKVLLANNPNLQVYIGDPGRVTFRDNEGNLQLIEEYKLSDKITDETLIENDSWTHARVWKLSD